MAFRYPVTGWLVLQSNMMAFRYLVPGWQLDRQGSFRSIGKSQTWEKVLCVGLAVWLTGKVQRTASMRRHVEIQVHRLTRQPAGVNHCPITCLVFSPVLG